MPLVDCYVQWCWSMPGPRMAVSALPSLSFSLASCILAELDAIMFEAWQVLKSDLSSKKNTSFEDFKWLQHLFPFKLGHCRVVSMRFWSCLPRSSILLQDFVPDLLFVVGTTISVGASCLFALGLPSWCTGFEPLSKCLEMSRVSGSWASWDVPSQTWKVPDRKVMQYNSNHFNTLCCERIHYYSFVALILSLKQLFA